MFTNPWRVFLLAVAAKVGLWAGEVIPRLFVAALMVAAYIVYARFF